MSLAIETFTNPRAARGWRPGNNAGGHSLFKALGHPLAARAVPQLKAELAALEGFAVYDPNGWLKDFAALHGLDPQPIEAVFAQRIEDIGRDVLGHRVRPITELKGCATRNLLVAAFEPERLIGQIEPMMPLGMTIASFAPLRLPEAMLSNTRSYLDPLNFATNFAFFRDTEAWHTRLVSANYWGSHGASDAALWLCLFDANGDTLAEWTEPLGPAGSSVILDSREVRRRFGLGPFTGSLFMHAIRVRGHDVVKYALDTFSESGNDLSCTHDANAWPADLYAGLPAPAEGETVWLWVQNSHPAAIPPGTIGVNLMGSQEIVRLDDDIPPFGTVAIDVSRLLPAARWPQQIEIQAGRYFVRPRYEVRGEGARTRIAHANVERIDLEANPEIPALTQVMGKGYIMPLPVLPLERFETLVLPTPMTTAQRELPVSALLIDADGRQVAATYLGRILRRESRPVSVDAWLAEAGGALASGYGHVELVYDFRDGGEADGWLHAIGRYRQRRNGHAAETSFGAHIYNTALVYRDEPQSYAASPPGLTTRIFLRLGAAPLDTFCHLIYPASLPWRAKSATELTLIDGAGQAVASRQVEIACGGSLFWRVGETFSDAERAAAGERAYVQVRDTTCRLFGFHGLMRGESAFCLDHMFGF